MNRLLGTLFALATLAAIAFAILNYGTYTSMCATPTEPATPTDTLEMVDTLNIVAPLDIATTPLVDDTTITDANNTTINPPLE